MKTALQVLAAVSMLVSTYEIIQNRIDGAILFSVWALILKYSSDQNN
jgi:hypothetical protein